MLIGTLFNIFWGQLRCNNLWNLISLFIAYPIVPRGIRGWSVGISGLAFAGLAIGCFLVIGCEPPIRRMIDTHREDPATGREPPEAMVSIICIAAALALVGELWFAWHLLQI